MGMSVEARGLSRTMDQRPRQRGDGSVVFYRKEDKAMTTPEHERGRMIYALMIFIVFVAWIITTAYMMRMVQIKGLKNIIGSIWEGSAK